MRLPPFRRAAPIQTPDHTPIRPFGEDSDDENLHGVTLAGPGSFRHVALLFAFAAWLAGGEDESGLVKWAEP